MGNSEYCETLASKPKRPVLTLPNPTSGSQLGYQSGKGDAPPTPMTRYAHPQTGNRDFGFVPPINGLVQARDSAPIVLIHGWQTGAENGMGVCHIWAEHTQELRRLGYGSAKDVPDFVARVIKPGASIFRLSDECGKPRLGVQNPIGLVVLSPKRHLGVWEWRVITAYDPTWFWERYPVGRVQSAPDLN